MTEERKTSILDRVESFVDDVEGTAVDLVARLSPWLAPLPTAYLTATATVKHLGWPTAIGVIAGVIIESLGLASVTTALMLREYNATRRKIPDDWEPVDSKGGRRPYRGKVDPPAPFALTVALAAMYFGAVTALTVALDTMPSLATYAPLVFPLMSLAGVTVLAIRADHRHRLAQIAERDIPKGRNRTGTETGTKPAPVAGNRAGTFTAITGTTRDRAVAILAECPGISGSELGRKLGRSERLGRKLKTELLPEIDTDDNGRG